MCLMELTSCQQEEEKNIKKKMVEVTQKMNKKRAPEVKNYKDKYKHLVQKMREQEIYTSGVRNSK